MGTGSTGTSNALFVIGTETSGSPAPEIVAWPPATHVPWPLIQGQWSAALNVADVVDASEANVSVEYSGGTLDMGTPIDLGDRGYRDGHLLAWDAPDLPRGEADVVKVRISGVEVGGAEHEFAYLVEPFPADPPARRPGL